MSKRAPYRTKQARRALVPSDECWKARCPCLHPDVDAALLAAFALSGARGAWTFVVEFTAAKRPGGSGIGDCRLLCPECRGRGGSGPPGKGTGYRPGVGAECETCWGSGRLSHAGCSRRFWYGAQMRAQRFG